MGNNVISCIKEYLEKYPLLGELFAELLESGKCYIIGGALREYKDYGTIQSMRDLDIVIQENREGRLAEICSRYNAVRNAFNGYKVVCPGLAIDVWEIEDTWAFREGKVCCEKDDMPLALQETVFLNMDAIIYDVAQDVWYEEKYDEAMCSNVLDVVLEDNPCLSTNILRAMIIRKKYDMKYSDKLKETILGKFYRCGHKFIDELLELQKNKYGEVILDGKDICSEYLLCINKWT